MNNYWKIYKEDKELLNLHIERMLELYSKKYKICNIILAILVFLICITKIIEFGIIVGSVGILTTNGELIRFPIPWFFMIKLFTFDTFCSYIASIYKCHSDDLLEVVGFYGRKFYGISWYFRQSEYI